MTAMRNKIRQSSILILLPAAVLAVLLCFFSGLSNLSQGKQEEDRLQLETAVRKAVVACYAAEGFYPPDLEYLQDQYGIQISNQKYTVVYHAFGANLMPDITVLERTT